MIKLGIKQKVIFCNNYFFVTQSYVLIAFSVSFVKFSCLNLCIKHKTHIPLPKRPNALLCNIKAHKVSTISCIE
jgi:hypothetical protein